MVNPANTPLPSKKDLMTPLAGLPRDQAIALAMRKYGIDELDAAFLVDIEQGVISGDTVGPKGHPDTVNRPS